MRIAYLDAKKGKREAKNSITVAFRNLIELKKIFGGDIYSCEDDFKTATDNYDIIVCGFGSVSSEYNKSTDFINRNKNAKIIWLVGEYEQSTFPALFYSQREYSIIANGEFKIGSKKCKKIYVVNFNSLLYKEYKGDYREKKEDIIYYGRWRQDRGVYFKKYLPKVDLSTSAKNISKFLSCGKPKKLIKPITWAHNNETLRLYRKSLYIEDCHTHTCFNNLANRFYEGLSCGVASIFDISCKTTLEKSKVKYDDSWFDISTEEFMSIHKQQSESAKGHKEIAVNMIAKIFQDEISNV